jgi:hypothetical protein
MKLSRFTSFLAMTVALLAAGSLWDRPARAGSTTYSVIVDTSSYIGVTGALELGFVAGDSGAPPATAAITAFTTDGALVGSPVTVPDVTGTLPGTVLFTNDQNGDYYQAFTYGQMMSFMVTLASTPNPGVPIDTTFSFYLYDAFGNPITGPNSPSGELLDINVSGTTGQTTVTLYSPPPPTVVILGGVPEPSSVVLLGFGVGGLVYVGRRQARRSRYGELYS